MYQIARAIMNKRTLSEYQLISCEMKDEVLLKTSTESAYKNAWLFRDVVA